MTAVSAGAGHAYGRNSRPCVPDLRIRFSTSGTRIDTGFALTIFFRADTINCNAPADGAQPLRSLDGKWQVAGYLKSRRSNKDSHDLVKVSGRVMAWSPATLGALTSTPSFMAGLSALCSSAGAGASLDEPISSRF